MSGRGTAMEGTCRRRCRAVGLAKKEGIESLV